MIPAGVKTLADLGHQVLVQQGAGGGSGISDADYTRAGATLVHDPHVVYDRADLIMKINAPTPGECGLLQERQVLFAFLHLAPSPDLTRRLLDRRVTALAYETLQPADGSLPLLTPMSEIAGRLAVQVGARCLEKASGGRGQLLAGVAGARPAKVIVLGCGTVGFNAIRAALGQGAAVTALDVRMDRLRELDTVFEGRVTLLAGSSYAIAEELVDADLVIGAVLTPGARTPRLLTRDHLATMPEGAAIVDVAVDQGGCAETTRPTTHSDPTYIVDGIVHYAVPNMPAAVARTATYALASATLPYAVKLAELGPIEALIRDPGLLKSLNLIDGKVVCVPVARDLGYERSLPDEVLY